MGINTNVLRMLLLAQKSGVNFASTGTIGRQGLHLDKDRFEQIFLDEFSLDLSREKLSAAYEHKFCEKTLELMGASQVTSFDYSDFEGASVTHDFNEKISSEHCERYSCVVEGGSLEHIFNFPVAIRNCMSMLTKGGHYIGISPVNNFSSHGFYQFSPDLYYRIFSDSNGFKVEAMFWIDGKDTANWRAIPDPATLQRRLKVRNSTPSCIFVLAKRTRVTELFSSPPQQSDYQAAWDTTAAGSKLPPSRNTANVGRRQLKLIQAVSSMLKARRKFRLQRNAYPDFDLIDFPKLCSGTISQAESKQSRISA